MSYLLSVVIPTHSRPKFLGRAISSALDAATGIDQEVLVIPNGFDDSWRDVQAVFKNNPRVRWLPLGFANACAARNHGIVNSRGKFIRFLDDDDYFFPAAAQQLKFIEENNLDLCSAPLSSITESGRGNFDFVLPHTSDFVAAAFLSICISGFTQGSIFRKSSIENMRWRENASLYDDYFWMLDLAALREFRWGRTEQAVASYFQHDGSRLSRVMRSRANSRYLVNFIFDRRQHLKSFGRQSLERESAVATALLSFSHSVFPVSPVYLSSVIRNAIEIDPYATPMHPVFRRYPWLRHHLLAAEWGMLPARYITRGYRRAAWTVGELVSRFKN